jgi:hypothetical protein
MKLVMGIRYFIDLCGFVDGYWLNFIGFDIDVKNAIFFVGSSASIKS